MSTPIEHKPLGPVDHGLSRIREIQAELDAGVSYRCLGRRYGLTKDELKSLQRFNTGRFYFTPSRDPRANQRLIPERADPVTQTLSGQGSTKFYHASDAWSHLDILRGRARRAEFASQIGHLNQTSDFTPTLN